MPKINRKKRIKEIDKRVKSYKDKTDLSDEQILQLMDDAIWLLNDFGREWDKCFPRSKNN